MSGVALSILVALAVGSEGVYQYDGLRVKFGYSNEKIDVEYLYGIPRTVSEVQEKGWSLTERPKGTIINLMMYCAPTRMVCSLYNNAGYVAGLQIAFPFESVDPVLKPEQRFVKWHAPAAGDEPAQVFWTASQYYFRPDSLRTGGGPTVGNNSTLQDDAVWVSGVDLMRLPLKESELKETVMKKQNCIPAMGTHYYYRAEESYQCEDLLPWFGLVKDGQLIGCGFQTFGQKPTLHNPEKQRQYFEDIPKTRSIIKSTIPDAPDCYIKLHETYGLLSIHIYYINDSWDISCERKDSKNPDTAPSRAQLAAAASQST